VNSHELGEPTLPPTEVVAVAGLRERRRVLAGELHRCSHLRRLLRARLDLTVAETLEELVCAEAAGPTALQGPVPTWPPLPSAAVETMVLRVLAATAPQGAPDDIVTRLHGLDLAMRHLVAHVDALQGQIDDVTAAYVGALGADPTACLLPSA
jgi:hypothetical protein